MKKEVEILIQELNSALTKANKLLVLANDLDRDTTVYNKKKTYLESITDLEVGESFTGTRSMLTPVSTARKLFPERNYKTFDTTTNTPGVKRMPDKGTGKSNVISNSTARERVMKMYHLLGTKNLSPSELSMAYKLRSKNIINFRTISAKERKIQFIGN